MKYYEKSEKLRNVCYDVRGPVMEEAERMRAEGMQILQLNIGNPAPFGFRAPETLIRNMTENLSHAQGYSLSKGIPEAREAIAEYCKVKGIPDVKAGDVYTGNGVSEMILMAMQGLLDGGDEVLIPAPDYPLWTAAVSLAGGRAVHYLCDEQSDWLPDIGDMRKKVGPRTKGIVIINPNNPTGALYPKEILGQIVKIAREHDLILFADEIYDRTVMDGGVHTSVAALASDLLVVTLNGLSKSHMVAGYRCGWMCLCGDKSRAGGYIEGLNMLSSMRLCSNVQSQYMIASALTDLQSGEQLLKPGGRIYEQRETITREIGKIPGLYMVKPKAAFYVFPRIDTERFHITDDEKFVLDLLHEKKILLVHGRGFNWLRPDHFRIVFLPDTETLITACRRLGEFLDGYRQT